MHFQNAFRLAEVSTDAMGGWIDRMRIVGTQAYVTEPIDIEELRRAINETFHAVVC